MDPRTPPPSPIKERPSSFVLCCAGNKDSVPPLEPLPGKYPILFSGSGRIRNGLGKSRPGDPDLETLPGIAVYDGAETTFLAAMAHFAALKAVPDPRSALYMQKDSAVLVQHGRIVDVRAGHVALIVPRPQDGTGGPGLAVLQFGPGEHIPADPGLPGNLG